MVDCRHGRGICPSESGRAEYFTILFMSKNEVKQNSEISGRIFRKIEAILEHFKFINQGPIWFSSVDRQIRGYKAHDNTVVLIQKDILKQKKK